MAGGGRSRTHSIIMQADCRYSNRAMDKKIYETRTTAERLRESERSSGANLFVKLTAITVLAIFSR